MGRKKINISPIPDTRVCMATFHKRRYGLFKKAHELAILCNANVAVIIISNQNRVYSYTREGPASRFVDKLNEVNPEESYSASTMSENIAKKSKKNFEEMQNLPKIPRDNSLNEHQYNQMLVPQNNIAPNMQFNPTVDIYGNSFDQINNQFRNNLFPNDLAFLNNVEVSNQLAFTTNSTSLPVSQNVSNTYFNHNPNDAVVVQNSSKAGDSNPVNGAMTIPQSVLINSEWNVCEGNFNDINNINPNILLPIIQTDQNLPKNGIIPQMGSSMLNGCPINISNCGYENFELCQQINSLNEAVLFNAHMQNNFQIANNQLSHQNASNVLLGNKINMNVLPQVNDIQNNGNYIQIRYNNFDGQVKSLN